jgi:hypothetical protein
VIVKAVEYRVSSLFGGQAWRLLGDVGGQMFV